MHGADGLDFEKADALSRNGKITELLDYIDSETLIGMYGFSKKEIQALRNAWTTLRDRRLKRKVKASSPKQQNTPGAPINACAPASDRA
jgi:hypothetical protein